MTQKGGVTAVSLGLHQLVFSIIGLHAILYFPVDSQYRRIVNETEHCVVMQQVKVTLFLFAHHLDLYQPTRQIEINLRPGLSFNSKQCECVSYSEKLHRLQCGIGTQTRRIWVVSAVPHQPLDKIRRRCTSVEVNKANLPAFLLAFLVLRIHLSTHKHNNNIIVTW